jgi:hypothetical protein
MLDANEAASLLASPVAVEEKLDGACVGLSVSSSGLLLPQNRGNVISKDACHPQFQPLWRWLAAHDPLRDVLGDRLIVYGEWCYARHSVAYDRLPDWFMAFDVYDREAGRFWCRLRRDELCHAAGLSIVPLIAEGIFRVPDLQRRMDQSRVGNAPMEGVYLRWDEGSFLRARAKLVRPDWVQDDEEHWSSRALEPNALASSKSSEPSVHG